MAAAATEPDEKDPGQARLSPHVPGCSRVSCQGVYCGLVAPRPGVVMEK
jgi:hypothetical protein